MKVARGLVFGFLAFGLLAACGKKDESQDFSGLFSAGNGEGGTPNSVQGLWRQNTTSTTQELRFKVEADAVTVAGRCADTEGNSVVIGKRVAAEVSNTKITLKEAASASGKYGSKTCSITAPTGPITVTISGTRGSFQNISVIKVQD